MAYYKITNIKGVMDYELIHGDIVDVLDIHYLKDYRRRGYYYFSNGDIKTCYLSTKETEANKYLAQFKGIKEAEGKIDAESLREYTRERLENEKTLEILVNLSEE